MTSISNTVATRHDSPADMIQQYRGEFAQVLPTHIKAETWVRVAVGTLRQNPKLMEAARNDVGALMSALMDAARKGLEPGTEEYYITARKEKGILKIKGMEGYRGIVERMYRAGAIASVIVQVVRENDKFTYVPGRDERPIHEIDWFSEDRGDLIGVYAYAVMVTGATSRVIVLNRKQVEHYKSKSDGSSSQYSPWNTEPEAMWLKTAARRLEPWVPTSAEYIREQLRAARDVAAEPPGTTTLPAPVPPAPQPEQQPAIEPHFPQGIDPETGEALDDYVDAEYMDEPEGAR